MKTKKILSVLLAFAVIMSLIPMSIASAAIDASIFDGGAGTQTNPYRISSLTQLENFRDSVNNGTNYSGVYIKQVANLDMSRTYSSSGKSWTPIGYSNSFCGTYDGNGLRIENMYIEDSSENNYSGLFGEVSGGCIKNVNVSGTVYAPKIKYAGGIVGKATDTVIENCSNSCAVTSSYGAGGIAGWSSGKNAKISLCYNTGNIKIENNNGGGIVGSFHDGILENCYNTGSVTARATTTKVGGIIGCIVDAKVISCYNLGTIDAPVSISLGGIIGYIEYGSSDYGRLYFINTCNVSDKAFTCLAGESVTEDELKSGKITYWLNDSQSSFDVVWKQTKSKDNTPNFWGRTIYKSGSNYVNETPNTNSSGVYQISTAAELMQFAELVNTSEGQTLNAVLTNDIDLSGLNWKPIGVNYSEYVGTFDGQNHTISNMNLTTSMNGFGGHPTYDYQGLFGVIKNGAVIKNFTVSGKITLANDNMNYIGGAVGLAYEGSKIENITSNVEITDNVAITENKKAYAYITSVGGIAGRIGGEYGRHTSSDIANCTNNGKISIDTASKVGGIAGSSIWSSTVKNSANYGDIVTNYVGHVAGVVGSACTGTNIERSMNFGDITVVHHDCIGGVVGYANEEVVIKSCGNYGNVTATPSSTSNKDVYVGGILGYINNSDFEGLSNCFNYGTISAPSGEAYCGAIVGWARSSASAPKMTDNYYYVNSCKKAYGGAAGKATSMTYAKIHTGETAYKLQSTQNSEVWGQTLSGDKKDVYPTMQKDGNKVYKVTFMSENKEYAVRYANSTGVGTLPEAPNANFVKWLQGNTANSAEFDESSKINSDLTVYAFKKEETQGTEESKIISATIGDTIDIDLNKYVENVSGAAKNFAFSIKVGSLPQGITLQNGTLSGTVSESGDFNVTFNVTNNGIALMSLTEFTLKFNIKNAISGTGTQTDPFQITSIEDLETIRDAINQAKETYLGKYFKLVNDIDMSTKYGKGKGENGGDLSWTPIGNINKMFKGHFNGNGHNITGLYINTSTANQGLFGYISDSVIENLNVSGSVTNISGMTAGIAAVAINSVISGCSFDGSVYSEDGSTAAGIVAYFSNSTIKNCRNYADINAINAVGGIGGDTSTNVSIENCYNLGNITASNTCVGGILGKGQCPAIKNCYNTGTIKGSTSVGGIIGNSFMYNGFAIGNTENAIENCYNSGKILADSLYFGGIIGYYQPQQIVQGTTHIYDITINNCYYLDSTVYDDIYSDEKYGKALSASQMKNNTNFNGWDFVNTWEMGSLSPILKAIPEKNTPNKADKVISTLAELLAFREQVNNGTNFEGEYVFLANDIDLAGNENNQWTPIGNSTNPFKGTFDGGGHKIKGLYNNEWNSKQGFFGVVNGGTLKNIDIYGYISADDIAGGLVGSFSGKIENCKNYVEIHGNTNHGGICGSTFDDAVIENCFNAVTVSGTNCVGGIVATGNAKVYNCYNTGYISGEMNLGGIFGRPGEESEVVNCYNTATVLSIFENINPEVETERTTETGSIVGKNPETITSCYSTVSKDYDCEYVTVLSSTDMKNSDKFIGWDFDTVWEMNTRPVLRSNPEEGFSKNNPIMISTLNELKSFRDDVNNGNSYENKFVRLANDIDLGGTNNTWTPIGKSLAKSFKGQFDGAGHSLTNLYISYPLDSSSAQYVGLFGYVEEIGYIRNLTVKGNISGKNYVGGIVGYNKGKVINCVFLGKISEISSNEGTSVGGISGYNSGTVLSCGNTSSISGYSYVGGLVGNNNGYIKESYNTGEVVGQNGIGGVAGYNSWYINNCYNAGDVSGEESVGGIVGYHYKDTEDVFTVKYSYNVGKVVGTTFFGGVVGKVEYTDSASSESYSNMYYLDTCVSQGNSYASALTDEQMKNQANFLSFDFNSTWEMNTTLGRPVIRYLPELQDFEVISVNVANSKSTTVVSVPISGTYTVIFADYDGGALKGIHTKEITVSKNKRGPQSVTSDIDIALDTNDKVMLWKSVDAMTPVCDAYVIE